VRSLPIYVTAILDEHHELKATVEIAMRMHGYRLTLPSGLMLVLIAAGRMQIQELMNRPWLGTNLTYGLDRLESLGLIRREMGKDRRTRFVEATEAGLRLAQVIHSSLEQTCDRKVA
jgi:DNA-binding MarR family transcriptional regulator